MADSGTNPVRPNTFELEADVNVEFNEAASRQQINSGESVKTLFGKLRKFLTDLKAVAFTGAYSDLSGTPDLTQYASKAKYEDTTINVGRKSGTTVGEYSTAEGSGTTASGNFSHTEGSGTTASGNFSHTEGSGTTASGNGSHSEGGNSIASGSFSHAEGADTTASNYSSHAGGSVSEASGRYSFSHGNRTQALHESEVAFGQNNISNDDTLFSIGDGAYNARHNAFEITKTGGKLHDKDIATTDLIPTSLPANGGNADTVDGYHIRCEDVATPNYNWFATFDNDGLSGINPERAYVGNAGNAASANCVKTLSVIGTASDCTHNTILEWANSIDGFGTACIIVAYGYPSDLPVQQEGLITVETCYQKSRKIITFTSYTDTGLMYQRMIYNNEWRYDWCQTKAGNADTLDGLHAEKFMRYEPDESIVTSINDMITPGTYGVYSVTPDFPTGYGTWGLLEVQAYGSICYQIIKFETNIIISRAKIVNQTEWSEWKRSCDGGNADTVDGLHASDFVRAFNGSEMDNNRILIPNDVHVGNWLRANAEIGMQYYRHSGCSGQTGLPDGANDWAWFLYDGLTYMAKTIYNRFFIMDCINSYNGWMEIYTSKTKPYISGSATVAANSTTCTSNHGFIPSAVIWWDGNDSGVATWFNETQFAIKITSSVDRTINYLIFK